MELEENIEKAVNRALAHAFGWEAAPGVDLAFQRSPLAARIVEHKYMGFIVFGGVLVLGFLVLAMWIWLRIRAELQIEASRHKAGSDNRPAADAANAPDTAPEDTLVRKRTVDDTPNGGVYDLVMTRYNAFLIFVPLGWLSSWFHWGETASFILNLVAIVPLATLTGDATEELSAAIDAGPVTGGLINASFGNAVEIIILLNTLGQGNVEATKGALLGSILVNELLVLGAAMFFGGLLRRRQIWEAAVSKEQDFSGSMARMLAQVSLFAAFCISMPSLFGLSAVDTKEATLLFSRAGSAVVLLGYTTLLIFQLGSHAELMRGELEDDSVATLTAPKAVFFLLCCSLVVAVTSHYMVEAMTGFTDNSGISATFVYVVLLPLVGNACEHAVAVLVATKDKMDLAIGIGLGSAIQMSLFATPLMVVVGWGMQVPMDLNFHPRNAFTLILTALLVLGSMSLHKTNWLLGFLLMGAYLLLTILYYFAPEGPL